MMKILKVGKLFYGKFPYKVLFQRTERINDPSYHQGWTIFNCKTWLDENSIHHRMYSQVLKKRLKSGKMVTVKASVFLMKRDDVDALIKRWPSWAESLTEPFSEDHIDILRENTKIIIRKTLMYRRYRYVVRFHRTWNDPLTDIDEWILNNLDSSDQKIKWCKIRWNPSLYLSSESDLFLVKLTWTDRISEILSVLTISDI